MFHHVYANNNEVAAKSNLNKALGAFPDVCMSPPSPPAGPIPVPYPNVSFSKDLQSGTKKVKVGGKPAALAQQSFYKSSPLGDEAATRTFGANVITHQITGKTYFKAWSFDVKYEGKNVCRHLDITTSNHACDPGGCNTPTPGTSTQTVSTDGADDKCPCCKGPKHSNQKGDKVRTVSEEEWYGPDGYKKVQEARSKGCQNVPSTADDGCGTYFVQPDADARQTGRKRWNSRYKKEFVSWYNRTHAHDIASGAKTELQIETDPKKQGEEICHKVPISAGGCIKNHNNLQRKSDMTAECQQVDDELTEIHGQRSMFWDANA